MGVAVRGVFGENSDSTGSCYQISNQVTLGFSEHEIMSGIISLITSIIQLEKEARQSLKNRLGMMFEDMIYRAYGILTNARMLSSEEALKLLSEYKLGVDMGMLDYHNQTEIISLMSNIQPASLQKITGKILTPEERDVERAVMIRKVLKK